MVPDQDPEDVEHRLRVQEFLQLGRAQQIQVYTTRHGLQRHLQEYHLAEQAIQNNHCATLLSNESIQQFLTTRLEHERQALPQVMAPPPDMLLTVEEYIEQLVWLGYTQAFYTMPRLRMRLTISCQICGHSCLTAEALWSHLHGCHPDHVQDAQPMKALLQWCLFAELGCFCNPTAGWGIAAHECVGILQLAIILTEMNWQIVVPWPFSSREIVQMLGDMLSVPDLRRIGLALISRRFHLLWQDSALLQLLSTRCLICQEAVSLSSIHAHLQVFHEIGRERVWFMVHQLAKLYADLMMEGTHCEWCGCLLPSYLVDACFQTAPWEHLQACPMMTQMALLLMMPRWSKPMYQPLRWPRQEEIAEARRLLDLRVWQFHAFAEQLRRTLERGELTSSSSRLPFGIVSSMDDA